MAEKCKKKILNVLNFLFSYDIKLNLEILFSFKVQSAIFVIKVKSCCCQKKSSVNHIAYIVDPGFWRLTQYLERDSKYHQKLLLSFSDSLSVLFMFC